VIAVRRRRYVMFYLGIDGKNSMWGIVMVKIESYVGYFGHEL